MELNESLVKVDQTLEQTVRNMERIVFENEAIYRNAQQNQLIIKPFVEIPVPGKADREQVDFLKYIQNF